MASQQDSGGNASHVAGDDLSRYPTLKDLKVGEEIPKPVYSNVYGRMNLADGGLNTQATITADGRVNIDIDEPTSRLRSVFKLPSFAPRSRTTTISAPIPASLDRTRVQKPPPLNIVIQVVGSRGDVQPFIALSRVLKFSHGHRVRLATHACFQEFVEENELEFFNIGGDPAELMAFMVKNPGLMPGFAALKNGDIHRRRVEIATIISGCWRSCFETGDGTGVPVSDRKTDLHVFPPGSSPFVADAIIANPPSFAHVHCAEKLGIPLHMMFTMPWSPTQAFPQPLASIGHTKADPGITNYVSYAIVEMMTWQGLGDIINRFREKSLGLPPISIMWAPSMISRLKIPHTYCWSPALIPKPNDWSSHIDVVGFYFLSLASNYTPSDDLAAFLAEGPPPIYIGFGSIVVDDPNHMTQMVFEAVRLTGQRALVSKGWGGLGADQLGKPDGVFMLGNCPHDWLFRHVSCVVHHGGAGTTAAGIAAGRSTIIVPFFGDQPFWGAMVAKAGAGPQPIPYKELTAEKLADAIRFALDPIVSSKAAALAAKIGSEHGSENGALSFEKHLHVDNLRCSLDLSRTAVFRIRRTHVRLSALAFAILNVEGKLGLEDVKLYRSQEYMTEPDPHDPVIGGGAAMLDSIEEFLMGFADLSMDVKRTLNAKGSRCGTQSPVRSERKSDSPSRTSSPVQASLSTPSTSDELSKSSLEVDPAFDGNTTPAPLPIQTADLSIPAVNRPSDESAQAAVPPLESAVKEPPTRKHARTINDIRDFDFDGLVCAGKSAAKLVNVGLRAPASFTMAVAKGFHNAPLLYGDDTVREQPKVIGIKSGVKAAGKQFGYGFFDGISGLATQPMQGAKKEGAVGAIKGFSKGIGGLIFKPAAAVWSLSGYTMSGMYQEIQKRFGESVENYIVASRCAQGMSELSTCTPEDKEAIIQAWSLLGPEIEMNRNLRRNRQKREDRAKRAKDGRTIDPDENEVELTADKQDLEVIKAAERANRRQAFRQLFRGRANSSPPPKKATPETTTTTTTTTLLDEYEHAIRHSVLATSQGNDAEDEMIERALRASMVELRNAKAAGEEEDRAYDLAMEASIREAGRVIEEKRQEHNERLTTVRKEQEMDLNDYTDRAEVHQIPSNPDKKANHETPGHRPPLPPRSREISDYDLEMQNALNESHRSYQDSIRREKDEMDMIMEYVKRQESN